MDILNSNQVKQYLLMGFILGLAVLLAIQLFAFFPGLLGALTLYIIMRQWFFRLTVIYNWKKWLAAVAFIVAALIVFVIPFIFVGMVLVPKMTDFLSNASHFSGMINAASGRIRQFVPGFSFGDAQMRALMQKATSSVPSLLGATLTILTNLILCFFLLYFMLVDGRKMERRIQDFLPLKDENVDNIWEATRVMVISNAIGIPLLAIIQAFTAGIGYYIFGVDDYILWGVITGIFSILPVVGTAAVWVPLSIYLIATGKTTQGVGLLVFSAVITVNIDNVLRFSLLKRLGDVHPIITVLGIIIGVPVFGFMGLIFGPLLISYFLLLIKIYHVEFSPRRQQTHAKPT